MYDALLIGGFIFCGLLLACGIPPLLMWLLWWRGDRFGSEAHRRDLENEAARNLANEGHHHPTQKQIYVQMISDIVYTSGLCDHLSDTDKQLIVAERAADWDRGDVD